MKGGARIVVADDNGRPHLRSCHAEPPFRIWHCGDRMLVAASSAAPLGGDELTLDVDVVAGTRADIGTVASTIVLPSPAGTPSTMTTNCRVGPGAHLDWVGEPTISVVGSEHTVTTTVDLHRTATCRIVEEVSLGRSDEPSGRLRLVMRVDRGGRALVRHDELFGPDIPGAGSMVSVGGGRHVISAILVGVEAAESVVRNDDGCRAAWLPLADDAAMLLAVGRDRPTTVRTVEVALRQSVSAPGP